MVDKPSEPDIAQHYSHHTAHLSSLWPGEFPFPSSARSLPACLYVCLFTCLSACLSVCLSACLSVCLSYFKLVSLCVFSLLGDDLTSF